MNSFGWYDDDRITTWNALICLGLRSYSFARKLLERNIQFWQLLCNRPEVGQSDLSPVASFLSQQMIKCISSRGKYPDPILNTCREISTFQF